MATTGNSEDDDLLKVHSKNYHPSVGLGLGAAWAGPGGAFGGLGPFALNFIDQMRYDEQVSLCLEYLTAPVANAEFEVESPDAREQSFVARMLRRFWQAGLEIVLENHPYGRVGGEPVYKEEDGEFAYHSMIALHPRDARPWTHDGKLVFVKVAAGGLGELTAGVELPGESQGGIEPLLAAADGRPAKGTWWIHGGKFNRWYGRSVLYACWWPWRAKTQPDAALESFLKWLYKWGVSPTVIRHPDVDFQETAGGPIIPAADYARRMLAELKAAGLLAFSSARDEKGNLLWEIESWSKQEGRGQDLVDPIEFLNKMVQRGCGIPDEVITFQGEGSQARAKVSTAAFYSNRQRVVHQTYEAFNDQILKPLCQKNGYPCKYKVKALPLLPPDQPKQGGPGQPPPGSAPGGAQAPAPGAGSDPLEALFGGGGQGGDDAGGGDTGNPWREEQGPRGGRRLANSQTGSVKYGSMSMGSGRWHGPVVVSAYDIRPLPTFARPVSMSQWSLKAEGPRGGHIWVNEHGREFHGPKPPRGEGGSGQGHRKAVVVEALKHVGSAALSAKQAAAGAAARVGQAVWSQFSEKEQKQLATVWRLAKAVEHKVMLGFHKSRELAVLAAKERGASEEAAARVGRILGTIDLITAWTVNMPATFAATGNPLLAKVSSWIPVASLSYVAYSTARNPFATLRAAKKLLKGKKAGVAMSMPDEHAITLGADLVDRIEKGGDWYMALYLAALDEADDPVAAMRQADEAFAAEPHAPEDDQSVSMSMGVRHAPAGGATIGGKQYAGGEFIPAEAWERATPEEKAKVESTHSEAGEGKPKRDAGSKDRVKSILKEAAEIEVTDEVVGSGGEVIGRRDYDEIESRMDGEQRRDMQRELADAKETWVDERMDDFTVDDDDIATEIDATRDDIEEKAEEIFGRYELEAPFIGRRKYGIAAIEGIIDDLGDDAPDELKEELKEWKTQVEKEWERAVESATDDARQEAENDYDEGEDKAEYLRQFYDDNEEMFPGTGVEQEHGKWYEDSDGDGTLTFETESGSEYKVAAVYKTIAGQSVPDMQFSDSSGSFKVTGGGEAFQVFSKVVPAMVAYIQQKDLPAATFSAAEPSRQRLYDRLVKTVASVMPGYFAAAINKGAGYRLYVISKTAIKEQILAAAKRQLGGDEPSILAEGVAMSLRANDPDDDSEWEELKPEIDPSWFTPEGWDDPDADDTDDTERRATALGVSLSMADVPEAAFYLALREQVAALREHGVISWSEYGQSMEFAAQHAPKGGITVNGKFYVGGRFIPSGELAADPEAAKKVEEAAGVHKERRRSAGETEAKTLKGQLAEAARKHRINLDTEDSVSVSSYGNRSYAALKDHHGDLMLHRIRELIYGDLGALKTAIKNKDKMKAARLRSRLAVANYWLEKYEREHPGGELDPGGVDGTGDLGEAPKRTGVEQRIVTARPEFTAPADAERVPENLRRHLISPDGSDHQLQGAAKAIAGLEATGGFLLADGAGAGKTRQFLATAAALAAKGKKVLIVAPNSILKPDWKTGEIKGSIADDSKTMGVPVGLAGDSLAAGGIAVTTYDRLDRIKNQIDSDTVVFFDEAHNLKNVESNKAKTGTEVARLAGGVLYASATPADNYEDIAYLFRTQLFGDQPWDKVKKQFSVTKHGAEAVGARVKEMFDKLTSANLMVKRELSLDGVQVHFDQIKLSPEDHAAVDAVVNAAGSPKAKASALLEQRAALEVRKVSHTTKSIHDELSQGRSVVVFVSRVNGDGKAAGTPQLLRERLKAEHGLTDDDIVEYHGGEGGDDEAVEKFQGNKAKVFITTAQSGGTGINLHDKTGERPRTQIWMTPSFSGIDATQMWGRTWRLGTQTHSRVRHIHTDSPIDDWNISLAANKMSAIDAIVAGETHRIKVRAVWESPELLAEEKPKVQSHEHVVGAVAAHGGPHNLAKIADVRDHLAKVGITDRKQQDEAIVHATRAGHVSGSAHEGRHGISDRDAESGLKHRAFGNEGETDAAIGHLSLRQPTSMGMVGDVWHGPNPPGEGWTEIQPGSRGGRRWTKAGGGSITPPPQETPAPQPAEQAQPATKPPDPGDRPRAENHDWQTHEEIAAHGSRMAEAHEADPFIAKARQRLVDLKKIRDSYNAKAGEAIAAQSLSEYGEHLKTIAAVDKEADDHKRALAHESRRSLLLSFGLRGQRPSARLIGHAARSTTPQAKNWQETQMFLGQLAAQDAVGNVTVWVQSARTRAYYQTSTIYTSENDDPSITCHELGHHLEMAPEVQQALLEFRRRRFGPEGDQKRIKDQVPQAGYGADEVTVGKDDMEKLFGSENAAYYAGKVYPGQPHTEILSMGLEQLYKDPVHFAKTDPEYFGLVMAILQKKRQTQ